jgi:hypothetical protein
MTTIVLTTTATTAVGAGVAWTARISAALSMTTAASCTTTAMQPSTPLPSLPPPWRFLASSKGNKQTPSEAAVRSPRSIPHGAYRTATTATAAAAAAAAATVKAVLGTAFSQPPEALVPAKALGRTHCPRGASPAPPLGA